MDLLEIMRKRRSIRKYTGEPIDEDKIEKILAAGLLSASSRAIRPWEFILVKDKETLAGMSKSRFPGGAGMLKDADAAIVVIADEAACDVWVEDCSIAMSNMHLMASSLGVGSCWIQGRMRKSAKASTEDYLRELLGYPEDYKLAAMLSLGMPAEEPEAYELSNIHTEKIHREKF